MKETSSIRQSIRAALRPRPRVLLAVSGGLDSMVLLDGAVATLARDQVIVATFDHGSGSVATAAASLVMQRAGELGVEVVSGRADSPLDGEVAWRDARWRFLREVAARTNGVTCTAHTADDQVETVLMRTLRGAGARGLAGLLAETDVLRPLLRFTRRDLARYARAQGLTWIEDPSNDSRRFLRNRIRHELLPALRRVRPSIDAELTKVGRRAAAWRADAERIVTDSIPFVVREAGSALDVGAHALGEQPPPALTVAWPVLAAKVGLALDRRGTKRLSAFSTRGRVGSRIQLSGGWQVSRSRDAFQLRRVNDARPDPECVPIASGGVLEWGPWTFRQTDLTLNGDPWSARLPLGQPLRVRPWQPGDTMTQRAGSAARKVKHFLSDAGVTGHERTGWPVVIAGDQIVWIPGVRRSDAAAGRSEQPGLTFVCEYSYR